MNSVSSDDSTDEEEVIRNFEEEAQKVIDTSSLPKKSEDRYNLVYETFMKWKTENKASSFEESILICYFKDMQKKVGPATLWSIWSILKKMINIRHNVNIGTYFNLKSILKNNSKGYKPKKSLTLTWDQVMQFINNASDDIYLGLKVFVNIIIFYFLKYSNLPSSFAFIFQIILIFGVCGALRCAEFINIKCCDVEDANGKFIVSIYDTKTYIDRAFIIGPLFHSKVKKYISLKPEDEFTERFFIQYANGKCHHQVMGKNKIGSTPSTIASFLGLENPSRYTGHCFRRTSATLLSNSGANMALVKQLGGWRSDTVANGYIADSMKSKNLIYQGITHESKSANNDFQVGPSTSKQNPLPIISSSEMVDPNKQVEELQMTYEDFCEEDFSSKEPYNSQLPNQDSPNFKTANGIKLPPIELLKPHNENTSCKLFTTKPPIKLSFNKFNKMSSTAALTLKKPRLEDNSSSSSTENENLAPIQLP